MDASYLTNSAVFTVVESCQSAGNSCFRKYKLFKVRTSVGVSQRLDYESVENRRRDVW